MKTSVEKISDEMISRYSDRYKKLGRSIKTLGWGTQEHQLQRFKQSLNGNIDFNSKSILDIGCGFGDYLNLLITEKKKFSSYTGWDINPDLIGESRKIWDGVSSVSFEVKNVSNSGCELPSFDIAVMFGLLNLNLAGKMDNYEYSHRLIKNAFSCVKQVLIVDFLSAHRFEGYPKEDFVFYHEPAKMLEFALSLTSNVVLKHDYAPIPQKEFMLFIYK